MAWQSFTKTKKQPHQINYRQRELDGAGDAVRRYLAKTLSP